MNTRMATPAPNWAPANDATAIPTTTTKGKLGAFGGRSATAPQFVHISEVTLTVGYALSLHRVVARE